MLNQNYQQAAEFFKLFSSDNRLKILSVLEKKPATVSEIIEQTALGQSLVSQQLKLLKNARVLNSEKQGKTVLYSVSDDHISHLMQDVFDHLKES
jgi:DNA-binding transcriptional ArsR family regulator